MTANPATNELVDELHAWLSLYGEPRGNYEVPDVQRIRRAVDEIEALRAELAQVRLNRDHIAAVLREGMEIVESLNADRTVLVAALDDALLRLRAEEGVRRQYARVVETLERLPVVWSLERAPSLVWYVFATLAGRMGDRGARVVAYGRDLPAVLAEALARAAPEGGPNGGAAAPAIEGGQT